jgi:8-oxo-dGTP pyrophosphatase MutT (NUDIX family)
MNPEQDRASGLRPGVGMLYTWCDQVLVARRASFLSSLVMREGQIVVESQPKWMYSWDIPQGGIEVGEGVREAVMRETEEELGPGWQIGRTKHVWRGESRFPVHKDGRHYDGKSYYYTAAEVVGYPEGFDDWVFPTCDEGPYAYPVREFPGGVLFLPHDEAVRAIRTTQRGWKADMMVQVIHDLQHQGFIH